MKELLCVVGPTATGKTAVAIELARRLNGEIVSCDSMQIYRGMDIGTAKASAEEQACVPHHMIDLVEPDEDYSAARYAEEAACVIEDIAARGRHPIVAGGTGLYLRALLYGLHDAAPDDGGQARAQWRRYGEQHGPQALHDELTCVDPLSARRLAPSDTRRVVRALEVFTLTGVPLSEHHERSKRQPPRYRARMAGLCYANRETLYETIDRRVQAMRAQGLAEEVRGLLSRGLSPEGTAMQAIGYKELVGAVLAGGDFGEAYAQVMLSTRRYAKRQMTWFRALPDVCWFEVEEQNPQSLSTKIMEKFGLL